MMTPRSNPKRVAPDRLRALRLQDRFFGVRVSHRQRRRLAGVGGSY